MALAVNKLGKNVRILIYLCDIGIQGGFMTHATKFVGRPPNDYLNLDLNKPENLVYVLMKIDKLI